MSRLRLSLLGRHGDRECGDVRPVPVGRFPLSHEDGAEDPKTSCQATKHCLGVEFSVKWRLLMKPSIEELLARAVGVC